MEDGRWKMEDGGLKMEDGGLRIEEVILDPASPASVSLRRAMSRQALIRDPGIEIGAIPVCLPPEQAGSTVEMEQNPYITLASVRRDFGVHETVIADTIL